MVDSWTRRTTAPASRNRLRTTWEIPKLNFQILRRTIATRAQKLGSVKDIQSHLRHSRADTTANEFMQELPESVQQMVGTVYAMLTEATTTTQQIM
jgi:integrase